VVLLPLSQRAAYGRPRGFLADAANLVSMQIAPAKEERMPSIGCDQLGHELKAGSSPPTANAGSSPGSRRSYGNGEVAK
jgi:hypothetical protein